MPRPVSEMHWVRGSAGVGDRGCGDLWARAVARGASVTRSGSRRAISSKPAQLSGASPASPKGKTSGRRLQLPPRLSLLFFSPTVLLRCHSHTAHPFKVYSSVVFSVFIEQPSSQSFLEHFGRPTKKPIPQTKIQMIQK